MAMIWDQARGEWVEDGSPDPYGTEGRGVEDTSGYWTGKGDNEYFVPYDPSKVKQRQEFVTINGKEYARPGEKWQGFKGKGIPTEWNEQYGYLVPADQYRAEQEEQRRKNASDPLSSKFFWSLGTGAFGGAALSGLAGAGAAEGTAGLPSNNYWSTLADAGGVVSDAAPAAAGSFLNPDLLPTVNVVADSAAPVAGGAGLGTAASGGALGGALASGLLFGGLGGTGGSMQLPSNITPETGQPFSSDQNTLQAAAEASGLSVSELLKYLNNPAVRTLLGSAASIGSAAFGANAAGNAADAQIAATNASIAEQRRQYDLTRADNAPFLATGTAANARLKALLGLDPSYTGADSGSLTRKFSAADLNADPVYQSGLQFGLNEGTKGINARAIGSGMYDSGATLKALTRYGNDYGSTKANESYQRYSADQGNVYNKLAGVSGAGQTAVNTVSSAGQNATNAISQDLTGAGNARAAGIVGGINAWGQAAQGINNSLNQYGSNQILEALLRRGY